MQKLLSVLCCVSLSSVVAAQAPVPVARYHVGIFAGDTASPLSLTVFPLDMIRCGQSPKYVAPLVQAVVAAQRIKAFGWDDPADVAKDCVAEAAGVITALPTGASVYRVAVRAVGEVYDVIVGQTVDAPSEWAYAAVSFEKADAPPPPPPPAQEPCVWTPSAPSLKVPATAGSVTFAIVGTPAGCAGSVPGVVTQTSWLTVAKADRTVTVTYAENQGAARADAVYVVTNFVGGIAVRIEQDGPPPPPLPPPLPPVCSTELIVEAFSASASPANTQTFIRARELALRATFVAIGSGKVVFRRECPAKVTILGSAITPRDYPASDAGERMTR